MYGTSWTIGAIVSYFSGIPLNRFLGGEMNLFKNFMPNLVTLNDILLENGYKNYSFLGSDSIFSGYKKFAEEHGQTQIYDYPYYLKNGLLPTKNYKENWGFEDYYLYEFSKRELSKISQEDTPFCVTIQTLDTHFPLYLDKRAKNKFNSKIKNTIFYMDEKLGEFVSWIKEQKFYENTTIAVLGDHQYYDSTIFDVKIKKQSAFPINIFINSLLNKASLSKNREWTHFDMFPTILHSIGITFNSESLGLGVPLDCEQKTLLEKMGFKKFNDELKKRSDVYDKLFI